jgi:hypothetical protein
MIPEADRLAGPFTGRSAQRFRPAVYGCLLPTLQLTNMTTQPTRAESFMEERGCHHGSHLRPKGLG